MIEFLGVIGVGRGPSQRNYELEVLVKTPHIYQVSELRNLILFIFRGLRGGDFLELSVV